MMPLAERMRPTSLEDFIGQDHLVGEEGILRKSLQSGKIPSFILWGPPGVGKTTLAKIIAHDLKRSFQVLSAVNAGVKEVRSAIDKARKQRFFDSPNSILFIDEIHRFSKSQQDSLLGAVEEGIITLIGATTENPSFEVISPLLSRCQVYILYPLTGPELELLAKRAIARDTELRKRQIEVQDFDGLIGTSGGDARRLLNAMEIAVNAQAEDPVQLNAETIAQSVQRNLAKYDKGGELHYDIISAFIKAIRGSDPNAAIYWLARMVEGGEDVKFICRRMIISAAEDIGLANPNALLLATATFDAVQVIGLPEARIIMAETAIYLAQSSKSNSAYKAISAGQDLVRKTGDLPVPLHLRNAATSLMKSLDYGKDYKYAHDYEGSFADLEFLPDQISGTKLYDPGENTTEQKSRNQLLKWWKQKYGYGE